MIRTFCLIALFPYMITTGLPQERVLPPSKKMVAPADTSRVEAKTGNKKEPDLELPDVLILGQDRAIRVSEEKRDLSPVSPSLLRPGSTAEPVSVWFSRQETKPALQGELSRIDRLTWAAVGGGGYTSFNLEGGHWRRLELGNYRIQGRFESSRGQFDNSQFQEGGLSGLLSYELAPRVTGNLSASMDLYGRGLHGARYAEKTTRSARRGNLGADLRYDINGLSDSELGFELGGTSVRSDTSSRRIDSSDDFWYRLYFGYTARLAKLQIKTTGSYKRDSLKPFHDSTSSKSAFGEIALETRTALSKGVSALVGLAYQSAGMDSAENAARFSPYGRLNLMPGNSLGLVVSFSTGYEFRTYSDYWLENPYLAHREISLIPNESRFALQGDFGLQLSQKMRLKIGFGRKWMEKLAYWESDANTGFFAVRTLEQPVLTQMEVGFDAELSERTRMSASFITYADRVDIQGGRTNVDQIPYRPDFRLPIRASIELLSGMTLALQADITGKRLTQLVDQSRLPAFGLLDATLSKDFGTISAVLMARNILDSDYVIWERYREMGVHILLGLRAKW